MSKNPRYWDISPAQNNIGPQAFVTGSIQKYDDKYPD